MKCWGVFPAPPRPPPSVNGIAGTASAISGVAGHFCAIQTGTQAVVCWGANDYGQATPPPSVNGTAGGASAIAAGGWQSCAIQAGSGAVICWGEREFVLPPVDGIHGRAEALSAAGEGPHVLVIHEPLCSDGLDADDDGHVDYPADP